MIFSSIPSHEMHKTVTCFITVKPLLNSHPLVSGQLSETRKLCLSFTLKKSSIKRTLTSDFVLFYTSIKQRERAFAWEPSGVGELCSYLRIFKPPHVIALSVMKCIASVCFLNMRYCLHMKFLPCLIFWPTSIKRQLTYSPRVAAY